MEKFKQSVKDISIERKVIFFLCFLLLLVGFFIFLGLKDAQECLGNPFTYGAREIVNEKTGNIYCTCSFGSPNYARFYFNEEIVGVIEG